MRNVSLHNRIQTLRSMSGFQSARDIPSVKSGSEGSDGLFRENGREQNGANLKELRRAAKNFESLFMKMMLKEMRETVPESKYLSGGQGEKVFQSMLDTKLATHAAKHESGIGIADMVFDELKSSVNRARQKVGSSNADGKKLNTADQPYSGE